MLLTPLSNVGIVDLEVCCSILGTFHSAPRYFNFIDRSELSVGRVPHTTMLEMLKIFWNGYHLLLQLLTDKVGRGSCNEVGSLKRISVLLTSLSNVGVLDLEVCCPIFGIFHYRAH